MKTWHAEGLGVKTIAKRLERSTDTVSKHVFKKNKRGKKKPVGRPQTISDERFSTIMSTYEAMLAEAKNSAEVSAGALKRRMRLKCSLKTLHRAFWARGVYLRPMYEKPTLTLDDKKARIAFAKKFKNRSAQQWAKAPDAIIDNKVFQVYTTGKARTMAGRRRMRGTYRKRSSALAAAHVKPSKALKQNTGARSVMIACAVGSGRVLMWHEVKGAWNGDAAAAMYAGPLSTSLKKSAPRKRAWDVMEDNDPSGYKSRKAVAAKETARIRTISLPPRSPDLNPLDYSIWAEINKRMRLQEQRWPAAKTESRQAFLGRLRRTAKSLPPSYIDKTVGSMAKRCEQVLKARGGHFPEGA